jgi:hypothetical protein
LLQENPDFKGLVDGLEEQIGTDGFGKKLASLVSNASGVVYTAAQVDKALKKIGMSLEQLKSAKDTKDLHIKVIKAIMAKNPESEELNDMMKAVKVLFENSYNREEIVGELSKGKRGSGDKETETIAKAPDTWSPDATTDGSDRRDTSGSDTSDVEETFDVDEKHGGAVIGRDADEEDGKTLPTYFKNRSIKKKNR